MQDLSESKTKITAEQLKNMPAVQRAAKLYGSEYDFLQKLVEDKNCSFRSEAFHALCAATEKNPEKLKNTINVAQKIFPEIKDNKLDSSLFIELTNGLKILCITIDRKGIKLNQEASTLVPKLEGYLKDERYTKLELAAVVDLLKYIGTTKENHERVINSLKELKGKVEKEEIKADEQEIKNKATLLKAIEDSQTELNKNAPKKAPVPRLPQPAGRTMFA